MITVAAGTGGFPARTAAADLTAPGMTTRADADCLASTIAHLGRPWGVVICYSGARARRACPCRAVARCPAAAGSPRPCRLNAVMKRCCLRRQRSAQHRLIAHSTRARSLAVAERTGACDDAPAAIVLGYAGRIGEAMPRGFRRQGFDLAARRRIFAAGSSAAASPPCGPNRMAEGASSPPPSTAARRRGHSQESRANTMGPGWRRSSDEAACSRPNAGSRLNWEFSKPAARLFRGWLLCGWNLRDLGRVDIVTDMAVKLVPGGHPDSCGEARQATRRADRGFAPASHSITRRAPRGDRACPALHPADLIADGAEPWPISSPPADRDFSCGCTRPGEILLILQSNRLLSTRCK